LLNIGYSQGELAIIFEVTQPTIWKIKNNLSWASLVTELTLTDK